MVAILLVKFEQSIHICDVRSAACYKLDFLAAADKREAVGGGGLTAFNRVQVLFPGAKVESL